MTENTSELSNMQANIQDQKDFSMENFLGSDREVLKKLQETVDRNIELYKITKEQLNRITVIYELTKAIISISDFDELLKLSDGHGEDTQTLVHLRRQCHLLAEFGPLRKLHHPPFATNARR